MPDIVALAMPPVVAVLFSMVVLRAAARTPAVLISIRPGGIQHLASGRTRHL